MQTNKIVRTICCFSAHPGTRTVEKLDAIAARLAQKDYIVQTKRVCSSLSDMKALEKSISDTEIFLSVSTLNISEAKHQLQSFYDSHNVSFNIDLSTEEINTQHTEILFDIMRHKAEKTFNFTYVFHNQPSSPYFPTAHYAREGFAIGLQPTDLSEGCHTLEAWLHRVREVWSEIYELFQDDPAFLGLDSSIAPLFGGKGSLIQFIRRLGVSFSASVTTAMYVTITAYLQAYNPKPIGLCGLMFPCLEDFALAEEYAQGNFPIERNIYLALHSGLGIDTYPIGVDENPEQVRQILKLLQGLAAKYGKALSARFVSDGRARVGEQTTFGNPYLKDVTIRPLTN